MSTTQSTPAIWDFVLKFYRQAGVSEAAITLQDSAGIDVNMILFLMWMAAQKRRLAVGDVQSVSDTSHGWQRKVVVPIREIRRLLKNDAPFGDPEAAQAYRKKVQALEIEGEQYQLNAMAMLAQGLQPQTAASIEDAARDNLATFATVAGRNFPAPAVDAFVRALTETADGE